MTIINDKIPAIQVTKYDGTSEPFKPTNLKRSLSKSGANQDQIEAVYEKIARNVYDGMATKKLYQMAFTALREIKKSYAARYNLKRALQQLGPEGFYFEQWVARLFQDYGFEAITGQIVQGRAVTHEIDVIALKHEQMLAIECKFRNDTEARISVTTPMAFMSRLQDIKGVVHTIFNKQKPITDGRLVTNAYFTSDSIKFAEHYGLHLLAWSYPENNAIRDRVDKNAEYPITCLTTLTQDQKGILLKNGCILVKDLVQNPGFLSKAFIKKANTEQILCEAQELIRLDNG